MPESVVTLTLNPTVDKSADCHTVVPEHKLRCHSPQREPGGGGINVSRVVRELGGETLALWTRGGASGGVLGALLDEAGLPHRALVIGGETRENLNVYEETSGLQYRFAMPGPSLTDEDVSRCLEAVAELAPALIVVSGSAPSGLPEDFYVRLRAALPSGARLVVDTSGPALRQALAAGVHLVKPNLRELGLLAGREDLEDASIDELLAGFVREGAAEAVVVSLGAAGAVVASAEGLHRIPAPTVPIRSKVGAGDSMVGGIAFALSRGASFLDAARLGVAAGAATVMSPGTALCRREDVLHLLHGMAR